MTDQVANDVILLAEAATRTQRHDFSLASLEGFDLRGKTLGVVGTGHIGVHEARAAHAAGEP